MVAAEGWEAMSENTNAPSSDYGRDIWNELDLMARLIQDAKDGHPAPMLAKHFVDHENAVHLAIGEAQRTLARLSAEFSALDAASE
jgi:hypothetical protein